LAPKNKPSHTSVRMQPLAVHELQSRQLCAVHTINNLLQLSRDVTHGEECCCLPATKDELDRIADELTLAENNLLRPSADRVSPSSELSRRELSYSDLVFSRHRTVWWGNYSYEVRLARL